MLRPSIALSHLTGSINSRHTAQALVEAGWLAEAHHTLAWSKPPHWSALVPSPLRAQLLKRQFPDVLTPFLRPHPLWEWGRLLTQRLPSNALKSLFSIANSNRRFDQTVACRLRSGGGINACYGYFDTSLHTFRQAKQTGIQCLYELPTPYWRTVANICNAERRRLPAWANSLPTSESLAAFAAQRDEELQLADLVIVPSAFVRDSLSAAPPFKAPVVVIPYGCPEQNADHPTLHREPRTANRELLKANGEPLKLLFAGTLAQSKGLADLLEAIAPLGDPVHLTLAGSSPSPIPHLPSSISQLGQLPHAQLLEQMREHDLFVLPTLYEGLSLALLEALSQGLPVLTTPHSGLEGLITNGNEGFLVPIQSPDAIRTCLEHLIADPSPLPHMAAAARSWAAAHSWSHYREQFRQAIESHVL